MSASGHLCWAQFPVVVSYFCFIPEGMDFLLCGMGLSLGSHVSVVL